MTGKVCATCAVELRCKKNGVAAIVVDDQRNDLALYDADLWQCPLCKCELILGFGRAPVAEHWQEGFAERIAREDARGHVIRYWGNVSEKERACA